MTNCKLDYCTICASYKAIKDVFYFPGVFNVGLFWTAHLHQAPEALGLDGNHFQLIGEANWPFVSGKQIEGFAISHKIKTEAQSLASTND